MATTTEVRDLAEQLAGLYRTMDLDRIDQMVDDDYVLHDAMQTDPIRGREGLRAYLEEYRAAFPDMHAEDTDVLVDGDRCAIRFRMTGTHEGELFGIAPTHRTVTVEGIEIDRFRDGRLVETTQVYDALGMFRQLGVSADSVLDRMAAHA